jgi:ankyrin repeat protein
MVACSKGYYEAVRMLIEKSAKINKENIYGQTAILFCFTRLSENKFKYENKKICMMMIELLLNKGADINVKIDSKFGYTTLMKLASSEIEDKESLDRTVEIFQFLLERGANKDIEGMDGKNIYDLLKENKYKDYLLAVINNTKQIHFYETNGNSNESSNKNNELVIETKYVSYGCCYLCNR